MALRENVYYWNLSLKNPEPFFDEAYMREEVIIEDTEYLKAVQRLRDLITTYCTMKHEQQSTLLNHPGVEHFTDWIISQIDRVLRNHKNIQYTEFVAFWKCADFSFSVFRSDIVKRASHAIKGCLCLTAEAVPMRRSRPASAEVARASCAWTGA
jgi:hypothetical protein